MFSLEVFEVWTRADEIEIELCDLGIKGVRMMRCDYQMSFVLDRTASIDTGAVKVISVMPMTE